MTQIVVIVLPPVVAVSVLYLIKHCVDKFTQYKELKLLIDSGVEHGEVTDDHVSF